MTYKEQILKLRSEGKSYREIEKILGCSKGTIAYHIGEGQKDKTNQNKKNNRKKVQEYLIAYKENLGCFDCKEKYPHYMLEFDHIPGYKKLGSVSYLAKSKGFDLAIKEIEKCEVVCSNCHSIRTWTRQQNKPL